MNLLKILRKKSIEEALHRAKNSALKKTLGAFDLTLIGVGCTIGTGIFVLTGINAAKFAGPAISISYLLAGIVCIFAALLYTEFVSMVPVAGSAYTYSYIAIGEFPAWIIAWFLILEYSVCASTVASGWSGYFVGVMNSVGVMIPNYLIKTPLEGGIINLPAAGISFFVGLALMFGTKESILVNRILVLVKIATIFIFLLVAAPHIKMENYAEFMPFGWGGVVSAAAIIFFAYVGFDSVAAAAEETKNPKRDLPIGIIGSLGICMLLYILVALFLTGISHFSSLDNPQPMSQALRENGSNIGSALVGTGAIVGMITAMLVMMYSHSRIFFALSRDGLLPDMFSKVHKKLKTPYLSCLLVMIIISTISGFFPLSMISKITSFGTLLAFTAVALSVLLLRARLPNLPRPFVCPNIFVIAFIAISGCSYLAFILFLNSIKIFAIWGISGIAVYFLYGYKQSLLKTKPL